MPHLVAAPSHVGRAIPIAMEQSLVPNLSTSERLTLRHIAEGEWHISVLDWVAIQRPKRMDLVEERDGITRTTKEGQRAVARIAAPT